MEKKEYFYWSDLPEKIPTDISQLSDDEKKKYLKYWGAAVWTKNVQDKDQRLRNIKDIKTIKITVPEWVMDRLKEAAVHYVNGFWLSTITVCGIISEFMAYYFLERYIKDKGIDNIIEHSKKLRDQYGRLSLLRLLGKIKEKSWKDLEAIRKIRNKYVHLNIIDDADSAKKNALVVLNNLISVLNSEKPMFTDYSVYLPLIEKFDKEVDVLK